MDSKKNVGIESLQSDLSKYLPSDTVANIMQHIKEVNDEVVEQDMMRRSVPQAAPAKGVQQVAINQADVIEAQIGIEVVEKLLEVFTTSELMESVKVRLAQLEDNLDKQRLSYENQILRLQNEMVELKKSDEDKLTERMNNVPAAKRLVLSLGNFGGAMGSNEPKLQQRSDQDLNREAKIQASLALNKRFLASNNGGGK